MLYADSCSEWCWFALYCRRIYFEWWTSFILQFTHGERNKTSRLRAVWGIWSVMDHPIQALTAPSSHLVVLYIYIIYIQVYSKLVSARVCRADFQVFFLMCFHSNTTPGADQSCCLRGSGWGTALAKPLAFPKRLLYLNRFFYFFCTLPCLRTAAVCGNSPSTRHIKSGHAHWKKG